MRAGLNRQRNTASRVDRANASWYWRASGVICRWPHSRTIREIAQLPLACSLGVPRKPVVDGKPHDLLDVAAAHGGGIKLPFRDRRLRRLDKIVVV